MTNSAADVEHHPVIPPIRVRNVPAVPQHLVAAIEGVDPTDVADLVGPLYTMVGEIRPLYRPISTIVGRALTVKAFPGDNLAVHAALALVEDGDILVIDWRGHMAACGSGARSLIQPFGAGLRGVVIDGAWRDAGEIEALGYPVFARGVSANSPPRRHPGEINVPVTCGGVVVAAGDLIVAGADCVAVIPREFGERVARALAQRAEPGQTAVARESRARARYALYRERFEASVGEERSWRGLH